jgi:hypothetical protein
MHKSIYLKTQIFFVKGNQLLRDSGVYVFEKLIK